MQKKWSIFNVDEGVKISLIEWINWAQHLMDHGNVYKFSFAPICIVAVCMFCCSMYYVCECVSIFRWCLVVFTEHYTFLAFSWTTRTRRLYHCHENNNNHRHRHKQSTNITMSAAKCIMSKITVNLLVSRCYKSRVSSSIVAKCKHIFYLRSVLTKKWMNTESERER